MATRSAGRVTIRVIPDSTKFREDLKKSLERVERTTKATIPAELAVTRESISKLKEQLRELSARIKVEPYITNEDLHDLKKRIEDVDPDVRVGLNSAVARARLTALTRPRTVSIFVKINKASLLAATQALAALSGARMLGNVFEKFWDSIKNLDKSAPRIAALSSGLISLFGILGAGVSNVAGLAISFAQLGQAAVLLPALLTGAGISIGVLVAAFKDMKTVLADLAPAFHTLQDTISNRFWKEAAQPIRDMVNHLMPTLNVELGKLASAWGRLFANLSNSIRETVTPDELTKMMGNLTKAVDIASRAMKPLVEAFNTLGSFGSQYLPRLSEWLVKLSDQFNNFIQAAANDGRLEKWAEQGIQAFKDLGRVLKETVRVFAALSRAASQAGGSTFAQLADGLKKLADTMNTANFQTTLITVLASAHDVVDGLIDGLNRLGPGLANFAPTIARAFDQVGKTLGQIGENIGKLLSVPELQQGIERMFSGLLTFITDLKPAMEPLGQIIGTMADIIGTFLSYFGLLLSDVAPYAADFFKGLWDAVKPLIPTLTDLVQDLLPPFSEILMTLAKDVLPELVPIIKELAPIFADLIIAFAPVLVEFLKNFARGLNEAQPAIKAVADVLKTLTDNFKGLPLAFYQYSTGDTGGFIGTMANFMKEHPNAAAILSGIGTAVGLIGQQLKNFGDGMNVVNWMIQMGAALTNPQSVVTGITNLVGGIASLVDSLGGWNQFWDTIGGVLAKISPIGPAFQTMVQILQGSVIFVQTLTAPWSTFWNNLNSPASLAMTLIAGTVSGGIGTIVTRIIIGLAGMKINWDSTWPKLIGIIGPTMANIASSVSLGFPGILVSIIGGMAGAFQNFQRGFSSIIGAVPGWFGQIVGGVGMGVARAVAATSTLPGQMLSTLLGMGGRFASAGLSLISDFAAGISRGVGIAVAAIKGVIAAVTGHLPGSPAKVGPLSGQGWSKVRGQHLVEDLAKGMGDRTDAIQKAAGIVARTITPNVSGAAWASVGSAGSASGDRALVHIEGDYYGATPEKVADEFDKKIQRANVVYKVTGVKK